MAEARIRKGDKFEIKTVTEYDLTPQGIIKTLDLKKPIYRETAKWGSFGGGFKWEK